MSSVSTGIDIVSITRIRRLSKNPAFIKKVFTEGERVYASGKRAPWRHLAGRFAAKEAVMKALGAGWGQSIGWKDIEVVNGGPGGRPGVAAFCGAGEILGKKKIFLSISYTKDFVAALAVIK